MENSFTTRNEMIGLGCTDQVQWEVTIQGRCVEVHARDQIKYQTKPPKRSAIQKFSNAARLRMIKEVARIEWPLTLPSLFITLTTPDDVADSSPGQRTRQRLQLQRCIETHCGKKVGALWKVEWMPRRSGKHKGKLIHHFHLILCNVAWIPWQKLRAWWKDALHTKHEVKTWVERIYSPLQAAHYVCKYMSKAHSLDYLPYLRNGQSIGRQWGVLRKNLVPFAVKQKLLFLDDADVKYLKRIRFQKMPNFQMGDNQSFTLFGEDVADAVRLWFQDGLDEQNEGV